MLQRKYPYEVVLDNNDPIVKSFIVEESCRQDFKVCMDISKLMYSTISKHKNLLPNREMNEKGVPEVRMIIQSMWFCFIITYMKSFTRSKRRELIDEKLAEQIINNKYLFSVHQKIRKLRNKYIGHSDKFFGENYIIKAKFNIINEGVWLSTESEADRQYMANNKESDAYIKLSEIFQEYIHNMVKKKHDILSEHLIQKFKKSEI